MGGTLLRVTSAGLGVGAALVWACTPFAAGERSDAGDAGSTTPLPDSSASTCAPGTDFARDARNCGECGRDCGKGSCVRGMCTPYEIANSSPAPTAWYIAVDASDVYFTSWEVEFPTVAGRLKGDGKVRAAPKLGGPTRIVAEAASSFDVALVGDEVFFGGNQGLFRVPKTGGPAVSVWQEGVPALDLFVAPDAVYFTGGAARRYSLGTGALADYGPAPDAEGIVADDTHVYWSNHPSDDEGSIQRVAKATASTPEVIESSQAGARRMAIDADAVYWTSTNADFAVMRRPKNGEVATRLFRAEVYVGSLVLDETHAYVAVEQEGRIVRFRKTDGSEVTELARDLQNPTGLAMDEHALYITERGTGRILRLRK